MLPFVEVPNTITKSRSAYREVFCRAEGVEHVSRYISGLLPSQNKTLQGIAAQQDGKVVSRQGRHAAVFSGVG